MNYDEKIFQELVEIRKLLTIFAQDKLDEFHANIKAKYLTTPERQQMYELFDGEKSLKEISDIVKISLEGVRKFCIILEQAGLIDMIEINKKQKNPKRLF
ncbi:MAG: hypothetical protein J6D15_04465 [Clostridia bacterium]|nr:hypothetical protein [Clostridia bacterium]